ncbi:MAG: HAD family phosphatase [Terriglobales bacterium]
MANSQGIDTILWDVGGVLLSNAWDHAERHDALARFGLNEADFNTRHEPLVDSFERGELSLDDYLDQTVFYTRRPFNKEEFKRAMFALSQPNPDALQLARGLASSGKFLMATLNNESRELNEYRIQTFGLRDMFGLFVSSCYVGKRKPDEAIYRLALDITQKVAAQCCFIDDRAQNLQAPSRLGMKVIQMEGAAQLRERLAALGVKS